MFKKSLKIFIITLAATLLLGLAFTYKFWFPYVSSDSFVIGNSSEDNIASSLDNLPDDSALNNSSDASDDNGLIKPIYESIPTPTPEPFEEYDVTVMAVGDNLLHMGIVNSGRQADGSYNYDFLFEDILPYLDKSDISIINQETIMAGNDKAFSGFPYFNSPTEVADGIEKAGFNVVLQSSNHTIDQGLDGLLNAYNVWQQHSNVLMVGIHDDPSKEHDIPIKEVEGIKVAILNYAYGPNLGAIPSNVKGYMNILCAVKEGSKTNELDFTKLDPAVIDDIKRADQLADIVIVCPHWGTEYALEPSSYQKNFAKQMTEAGADVIIGAHPHVPEPVELIEADNGNKCLCYYSLGNYVSTGQQGESMLEGLAWVSLHVTENDVYVDEGKSGVLPLVNQYLSGPLRYEGTYALEDYTDELASKHGIRGWGGVTLTVDKLKGWSQQIFGEWAITKDFILNQ